ncbi:unnamed protein product [Sphagnum troendelagicum]|uniref:Always early n=1 Tax=Sphagnum troendelagicum TaxID=128251 RepID=A0ABP0UGK1_9BRYO
MASARRPRTSARPAAAANKSAEAGSGGGVAAEREYYDGGEKSKQRKRKLTDMLGPPWSEDDLELFYHGFRKYGKNWKKVAGSMHKRTVEMVEALYNTNKAYLSLPEGAASAAGLIAMMTDHYNLLDESQSQDEDTSDELGISDEPLQQTQPLKLKLGAGSLGLENSMMRSNGPVGTNAFSGASPAKKPRSKSSNRSRTVGKRISRFPVESTVEQKVKHRVSPTSLAMQDEEESDSHVVVAQTVVSRRTASPSVSNTPSRRSLRQVTAQQNGESKVFHGFCYPFVKPATAMTARLDFRSDESQESKEYDGAMRASSSTCEKRVGVNGKKAFAGEARSRLKRPTPKVTKLHNIDDKYCDAKDFYKNLDAEIDVEEEEEEGYRHGNGADGPVEVSKQEAPGHRHQHHFPALQRPKKRSRQLFSGDNNSGLDALATLAASSLTLEDSREETESIPEKQASPKHRDAMGETNNQQANVKLELENGNVQGEGREKDDKKDTGSAAVLVVDRQPSTSPESQKRKRKTYVPKANLATDEDAGVVLKPRSRLKRTPGTKALSSKPGPKPIKKQSETAAEDGDLTSQGKEPIVEEEEDQAMEIDESSPPLKLWSKKKGVPEKFAVERVSTTVLGRASPRSLRFHVFLITLNVCDKMQARLTHCLCPKIRRWCMCEWFYSAIDLPWFARNEFVEYLNHAGLGHVPRLTRVEWGVIRGSLGKPRRLSKRFLEEEREKLAIYRDSVRTCYHELRTGLREGLPVDLARPLTVGQKVIARHPKTREMHDGSILTVDRCRCRVQFDRPDLGVELVQDIDAMPIHPLENMPEVMRRCRVLMDSGDCSLLEDAKDHKLRVAVSAGGAARAALNERLEWPSRHMIPFTHLSLNDLSKRAQADSVDSVRSAKAATNEAAAAAQKVVLSQPFGVSQSQARDADVRALADLSRALDKKEALVVELRQMNDEANANCDGLRVSEGFQRQYATVVLQLKEANKQVTTALIQLRQRNKYQENAVPPWHRCTPQGLYILGSSDSADMVDVDPLDQGPGLAEMANSAKKHARLLVNTAVKAINAVKEGEDAFQKLGCALESSSSLSGTEEITNPDFKVTGSPAKLPQLANDSGVKSLPTTLEAAAHDLMQHLNQAELNSENTEGALLVEFMTSCVATLFMLQTLSDRTYSLADVNQTLDIALMSLRPKSAQNHFIYKEIEQQLGIVKAQIMALIPIRSAVQLGVDTSLTQTHNTQL